MHPIPGTPPIVRDRNDHDSGRFDAIDDSKREAVEQVPPGTLLAGGPCLGAFQNGRFGFVQLRIESRSGRWTPVEIPSGGRLGLDERLDEIHKLAGHVPLPRGCVVEPPTMDLSWLVRTRSHSREHEFPRPTPLRHPHPLRHQGYQGVRQPTPRAPLRGVEGPQRAAVLSPCFKRSIVEVGFSTA